MKMIIQQLMEINNWYKFNVAPSKDTVISLERFPSFLTACLWWDISVCVCVCVCVFVFVFVFVCQCYYTHACCVVKEAVQNWGALLCRQDTFLWRKIIFIPISFASANTQMLDRTIWTTIDVLFLQSDSTKTDTSRDPSAPNYYQTMWVIVCVCMWLGELLISQLVCVKKLLSPLWTSSVLICQTTKFESVLK